MSGRSWILAVVVACVALLASANDKKDKATKQSPGGTWILKNITWSTHTPSDHSGTEINGHDGICVFLKKKPSGSTATIRGEYLTPFAHVMTGSGLAFVGKEDPWYHGAITDAKGKYKMYGGSILVGSGQSLAAHTYGPAQSTNCVGVSPEDKLVLDWNGSQAPQPLPTYYSEGGIIMVDGNGDGMFDAGGNPVWETPPAQTLRLTSSVVHQGGGVVEYTYTLENFTDTARVFSVAEITSLAYPTGWSGTLPAYGTMSTSVIDTPSDAVFIQNAVGHTWTDDADALECTATLRVYVPESRLATQVEVSVTSAGYDLLSDSNIISFHLSEPAEGAVLYRTHDGSVELVDELAGPLAAGFTHDMSDGGFDTGQNAYSVVAGTGANGHRSNQVSLANE